MKKKNECATIDHIVKPPLLKKLIEAFEVISRARGFGSITITVERGRPTKVQTTVSELIKDE